MKDGLGGEKRVLHTIDDYTRIYFVFMLYNNKLDSLIKCLKAIAAYVFRQYSLIIQTWRHDSLPTLIASTQYNDWTWDEGYAIKISAPHTQAQNRGPERARGVIALKATSLLGDSKLLEKLWPEAVITARYLLNRTPMRILN
jgi:transposase InsO family protein